MSFTVRSGAGRKKIMIVSGPSGAGKTTFVNTLLASEGVTSKIRRAVSHTTRQPRGGEVNGEDYFFVDTERFRDMVDGGKMIESAVYSGNYYGVSWAELDAAYHEGKVLLMTIEVEGHAAVCQHASIYREFDVFSVFIEPDSMDCLTSRVEGRGDVNTRMQRATVEMASRCNYDAVIINPHGKPEVGVGRFIRLIHGQLALWGMLKSLA